MASYHVVAADGQKYGPADEATLANWARDGRVSAASMIETPTGQVIPASTLPFLAPLFGPARPAAMPPTIAPMPVAMPPAGLNYQAYPASPKKGLAIAGMVLGIVSLALFCAWWLSIPCAITGIILSSISIQQNKRGEAGGRSMAMAGLVCALIAISLDIILIIVGVSILSSSMHRFPQSY